MKKLFFVAALLCSLALHSNAQDGERQFHKFKGEVSLGYANFPGNSDIKSGFLFALEPRYMILDQLAVGGRFETNILFKNVKTYDGYGNKDENIKIKVYQSFCLTSEFYFTKNPKFRPFIGAGGGLFLLSAATSEHEYLDDEDGSSTKLKFGGLLRAGVEIGLMRIAIEYNMVPKTFSSYEYYDNSVGNYLIAHDISKNSYIGAKIGFCFPKAKRR